MGDNKKSEYKFEYFVVCFIDLLGQSNHLKKWSKFAFPETEEQKVKNAIFDSVGSIFKVREQFEHFFNSFNNDGNLSSHFNYLASNELHEQLQRSKECKLGIQQFSDSFVFYAPLFNTYGDRTIAPLTQMLLACAIVTQESLLYQIPLRGAVTIGTGVELEPGNFYGPALAKAYEIERSSACYPRVLIDFEVEDFINSGSYSDHHDMNRVMSGISRRICKQLIHHEKCEPYGYAMVDFMSEYINNITNDDPDLNQQTADCMYNFAVKEFKKFSKSNLKLAYKYRRLLNYMNEKKCLAKQHAVASLR